MHCAASPASCLKAPYMTDKHAPASAQPDPGPELQALVVRMTSGDSVAKVALEPDPSGDPDRFHVRVVDAENAK